jgi:hypothetical protein
MVRQQNRRGEGGAQFVAKHSEEAVLCELAATRLRMILLKRATYLRRVRRFRFPSQTLLDLGALPMLLCELQSARDTCQQLLRREGLDDCEYKMALARQPVSLHGPVMRVCRLLEGPLQAKGDLKLEVALGATRDGIDGDVTRLSQVLSDLLGNAIKFTPEAGGKIRVESCNVFFARGGAVCPAAHHR